MSWSGQPCSVAAGDVSRLPPAASLRALVTTSDSCALFNLLNQNHGVHDPYQVCILTSSPWWCLIPFKIFKTPLLEIIWPIILCICLKDMETGIQTGQVTFQTSHSYLELERGLLSCGLDCSAMPCKVYISWFGATRKALFPHFLSGEAEGLELRPTGADALKFQQAAVYLLWLRGPPCKGAAATVLVPSPQPDSWTLSMWVHRNSGSQMTSSGQPWHMTTQRRLVHTDCPGSQMDSSAGSISWHYYCRLCFGPS